MSTKKSKKPNVYSYKCDIYPTKLDIMFDINHIDFMNETYGWAEDPESKFIADDSDHYGSTYDLLYNKNNYYKTVLVVFDGIPKPPQMAHEAFHVMNGIFKSVDLEFNCSKHTGNEHLAYIIEWAVKCMCDAIEKEKKCKKKNLKTSK